MSLQASFGLKAGKIMLVGTDPRQILERRFTAAGFQVVKAPDERAAIDHARRELVSAAVLVSSGSLTDVAEAIFNLRDLNSSMEIFVLVGRAGRYASRFLRQLIEHPIDGTRVVTRRQLQTQLRAHVQQSPPAELS